MPQSICDLKGASALDALNQLAAKTGGAIQTAVTTPRTVTYLVDRHDHATRWARYKWGEPPYWPPYVEVVAALSAREESAARKQILATEMMMRFFFLESHRLPPNAQDAEDARENLKAQSEKLDDLPKAFNAAKIDFAELWRSAQSIANEFDKVTLYLVGLDQLGLRSMEGIQCLSECQAKCKIARRLLTLALQGIPLDDARSVTESVLGNLRVVRDALSSIISGYCTVTNNEAIPSFFLLRLLIPYRFDVKELKERLYPFVASALLTSLLHNQQQWLFKLMQSLIADLAGELSNMGKNDVVFFLKGGRGISYLSGIPESGENDWDTQILINPELPWNQWWERYELVRDVVNNRLLRYNFIFSANLMNNTPSLIKTVEDAKLDIEKIRKQVNSLEEQEKIDEEAIQADTLVEQRKWQELGRKLSGECKAELIDVGLPRYFTIELLEQWRHVRETVQLSPQGIPYPGAAYFIDELIGMVRQFYAGVSPSPDKMSKRLARLLGLLAAKDLSPDAQLFLNREETFVKAAGLINCLKLLAQINDLSIKRLMTILLGQFCVAYWLDTDQDLARAFDEFAFGKLQAVVQPSSNNSPAEQVFSASQEISTVMIRHLAARGDLVLEQTGAIAVIVQALAQMVKTRMVAVVEGSLAILLHQRKAGPSVKNGVSPAVFATVALYLQDCASAQDVTDEMLKDFSRSIEQIVSSGSSFGMVGADSRTKSIRVFAKNALPLIEKGYAYQPLMIAFELKARSQLNMVMGSPTSPNILALPSLISWCRSRAADVSEWAMRQTLSETFGALIEMQAQALEASTVPRQVNH